NGLDAAQFAPLVELDPQVGDTVLEALGRAGIAAYLEQPLPPSERERLFVSRDDRTDARAIVGAATRSFLLAAGADPAQTDAEFAGLIADWHVDTVAAVRAAERDLTREDAEWRARLAPPVSAGEDDDEHYVPPAPPPLPRLSLATVAALVVLAAGLCILAFGRLLGVTGDLRFLLGVAALLLGAGMLAARLRDRPVEDGDDGAVI
ncbi:MAG: hypothetical protein JOZ81_10255, partial [Chloroflexi bacterium]|nr:hypothetical protein [Chloroflexota bacterium]